MRRFVQASVLLALILSGSAQAFAATAELLVDIDSSIHGVVPVSRTIMGVVFVACDGARADLWSSDGTAAGTFALPGTGMPCPAASLSDPLANDGLGFFLIPGDTGRVHLWRTDGTAAGTFRVTPNNIGPITGLTLYEEGVAFTTPDKIWLSNGSLLGTSPLAALPVAAGEVRFFTGLGDWLFFVGRNGDDTADEQLWFTDGTVTRVLTDFHTFAFDPVVPPEMERVGDQAFFVAEDRLWRTDGTIAGTEPMTAFTDGAHPSGLTSFQDRLFFMADSDRSVTGRALWRSDGTPVGTREAALIGTPAGAPASLEVVGDRLYFAGDDGVRGIELWRSDGTDLGTALVRDIAPGAASSNPAWLASAAGRVFFAASDGTGGSELWETDGTADGTRRVRDIAPGAASSNPQQLTAFGGRVFFTANDGVRGREPWVLSLEDGDCVATAEALCLSGGRFRVTAEWRDFAGNQGTGHAVALTGDTGYFWFFNAANVEVILKVLDGRSLNDHFWVFYGALSNVEYALTVTDTETGAERRYENPARRLASVADTEAFGPSVAEVVVETPEPLADAPVVASWAGLEEGSCAPSSTRLCLNGNRFAVQATWKDFQGNTGVGQAVELPGGDTGYFWFFNPNNVELVLKVLDGRTLNDKFWVFYGALSSVEYTVTVTDTVTGAVKTYTNPSGRLSSVADTGAF